MSDAQSDECRRHGRDTACGGGSGCGLAALALLIIIVINAFVGRVNHLTARVDALEIRVQALESKEIVHLPDIGDKVSGDKLDELIKNLNASNTD